MNSSRDGESIRAAFEWWASDEGEHPASVERAGNGYKLAQTQAYWMSWNAALASAPVAMIDTAKLAQLLDSVNGDCYLGKEKEEELAQSLRSQLRAPVAGEVKPVAVLRLEHGAPGRENEMPRVVSCNRLPDGDYPVYAAPQASPAAHPDSLDAAVEAIQFALSADEGMDWLRCWNEGDFEACRREWPETPEACFIGADPLHPGTKFIPVQASPASDGRDAPGYPMQPVVIASDGVARFKENRIVRKILEVSNTHGYGLNEMAWDSFTDDERMQFAQLIGYSVSSYGNLSYVSDESRNRADAIAAQQGEGGA